MTPARTSVGTESQTRPRRFGYDSSMTLIFGHRGASAAFTENTVEAFVGAQELGADWVELDVQQTADGQLAVYHDEELEDGRNLFETAFGDLPDFIPTLAEAIEACGDMGVNIEIKNDPAKESFDPEHSMVPGVLAVAREHLTLETCLISSFDMGAVNAVRDLDSRMPTALITMDDTGPEVAIGRATAHSHGAINPWDELVSPRWINCAGEAGLTVNVWTVDDPERMVELARLGVAGIITNVPDVAAQALR